MEGTAGAKVLCHETTVGEVMCGLGLDSSHFLPQQQLFL